MGEMTDIPSPEEQKEIILMQLTKSLVNGETWYLIHTKWFSSFKQFIGIEKVGGSRISNPGPIDNSSLLDEEGCLRKALSDKLDYEVVPSECWDLLVSWYGLTENQEPISRKVIKLQPNYSTIEVYPVELKCYKNSEIKKNCLKIVVSKADTLTKVITQLKNQFNINQNVNTRLQAIVEDNTFIPESDHTIAEAGITSGSSLIIEVTEDGVTPRSISLQFTGGGSRSARFGSNVGVSRSPLGSQSSVTLRVPGVCGLNNLGNTCFMNSVLQCMSNCPPITEYFLIRKHLHELNETNPLGMKGEIAWVYGELIQTMWSGNYSTANPSSFKIQVGKFNPTFSGCQQHDSQELLTFLLDGLHEDLNRIKKKPYIEVKDNVGMADSDLAKETWETYKKRNDSVIVDTFHGLLKSRVVCPECERVSVTFDPFCYLSLPLPLKKDRILTVRYIPFDGNHRESNFRISVPLKGVIWDLCQELSRKVSCKATQLLVAEITHCHFHKFYGNEDTLDNIDEKDIIFVYQLPAGLTSAENDDVIVPVCFWEKVKPVDRFAQNHLFGVPFLVTVPRRSLKAAELYNILKDKMKRHFVLPDGDIVNGVQEINNADPGTSQQKYFPLYTMDLTKASPNPQPVEFVDNICNFADFMEDNYNDRCLGRTVLIVQMTAEERRECYREKPAEYGPDLILSQSNCPREVSGKIDLKDCISLFTTCEKLSADDAWYCPSCKTHQRATKKLDLWKLPKILIIHLKRFSYTRCRRDKIDTLVEFPINDLSISSYVINTEGPDMKYDLIGVCNHYGHLGGGHYTAFCKNKSNEQWYSFDDTTVSLLPSEDAAMSAAAYVLFYMAKDDIEDIKQIDERMDVN